jgi:hypothetical protein
MTSASRFGRSWGRSWGRRDVLGLGVGAAAAAALRPAAAGPEAEALPEGVAALPVAPAMAPGSLHLMRARGLAVLVTAPGRGLAYPMEAGRPEAHPEAHLEAAHRPETFVRLRAGPGGIALRPVEGSPAAPPILAVRGGHRDRHQDQDPDQDRGLRMRADRLAHLAARLAPDAPGVLYA